MIEDWAKHIDEVWNDENWREKMDDRNLYTETVQAMKSIDKDPYDIRRIGSYDGEYECSWLLGYFRTSIRTFRIPEKRHQI